MPTTTTRLALTNPLGVDNPSVLRTSITANDAILDNAVLYTEGTLASRPLASAVEHGHEYRSTDTGQISKSNGTIWIDMGGLAPPTVTSLPGSPYDGQLIDFVADDTNGVIWRFRYRSAASSHKWEFIGGPPLYAEVQTSESPTGSLNAYVALATAGPAIALPLAGDYGVTIGAYMKNANVPFDVPAQMSYDIGGTGAVDADAIFVGIQGGNQTIEASVSRTRRKSGLTAVTLTAKYNDHGYNAGVFADRFISVLPVRVG